MPQGDFYNDDYLCPICKRRHSIRKCRRFLSMPLKLKLQLIDDEDICKNCLGLSHRSSRRCLSKNTCHVCHRGHHTVLHPELGTNAVFLDMTATVYVAECEAEEEGIFWRIKLDPSQPHSTVAAWSIYMFPSMANVVFFPETISAYMWSRFSGADCKIQVNLKVVDQPMKKTPARTIKPINIMKRVNKRNTADLYFWRHDYTPITLGADVARKVYLGAPKLVPVLPMSQCTIFGWVFFGHVKPVDIRNDIWEEKHM